MLQEFFFFQKQHNEAEKSVFCCLNLSHHLRADPLWRNKRICVCLGECAFWRENSAQAAVAVCNVWEVQESYLLSHLLLCSLAEREAATAVHQSSHGGAVWPHQNRWVLIHDPLFQTVGSSLKHGFAPCLKDIYVHRIFTTFSGTSPVSRCVHEAAEEADWGHWHGAGPRYDQRPKIVSVLHYYTQHLGCNLPDQLTNWFCQILTRTLLKIWRSNNRENLDFSCGKKWSVFGKSTRLKTCLFLSLWFLTNQQIFSEIDEIFTSVIV